MTRWQLIWRNFRLSLRDAVVDWRKILFAVYAVAASEWVLGGWKQIMTGSRMGPFGSTLLGVGVLLAWLFLLTRVRMRKSGLQPGFSSRTQAEEQEYRKHRRVLAETLLRTAVMVDRAAAEAMHFGGQMTPEHLGGLRRRSLELARRPELWLGYSEVERNLLMDGEGSWPQETTYEWLGRVEDVRVLRWVLGLDEVLAPFEFLESGLEPAYMTTQRPEAVLEGTRCLPSWDLRPAQSIAEAMVNRCVAEGFLRDMFTEEDEGVRAEYVSLAERMRELRNEDLLIGEKTVREASDEEVRSMGRVALRRLRVLTAVNAYLNGPTEAEFRIEGLPELAGEAVVEKYE